MSYSFFDTPKSPKGDFSQFCGWIGLETKPPSGGWGVFTYFCHCIIALVKTLVFPEDSLFTNEIQPIYRSYTMPVEAAGLILNHNF